MLEPKPPKTLKSQIVNYTNPKFNSKSKLQTLKSFAQIVEFYPKLQTLTSIAQITQTLNSKLLIIQTLNYFPLRQKTRSRDQIITKQTPNRKILKNKIHDRH